MNISSQLKTQLKENYQSLEFWYHSVLYLLLIIAFWPITRWFADTAQAQSRILHAFIVIVFATGFLIRFSRVKISAAFTLNPKARVTLIAAYALLFIGYINQLWVLKFPNLSAPFFLLLSTIVNISAYCLAIASVSFFLFGKYLDRIIYTISGTFCVFLLFSTLLEPLDWPLRGITGQWSAALLGLAKQNVALQFQQTGDGISHLLLIVNGQTYHVATECNGFGVILTSILISVMLVIFRKRSYFDCILNIMTGAIVGFAFNIFRIISIVMVAPLMMNHYHLIHEVIGGIAYWSCLIFVWWLFKGPIESENK